MASHYLEALKLESRGPREQLFLISTLSIQLYSSFLTEIFFFIGLLTDLPLPPHTPKNESFREGDLSHLTDRPITSIYESAWALGQILHCLLKHGQLAR